MVEITEEEILEELEDMGTSANKEVLSKMKELCMLYHQNAEEIVTKWIAYGTTKGIDIHPTIPMLDQLEQEELNKVKTPSSSRKSNKGLANPATPLRKVINPDYLDVLENYSTPVIAGKMKRQITPDNPNKCISSLQVSPLSTKSITPSTKYCSRSASGDIVTSFRLDENIIWKTVNDYICNINYYDENLALTTKYFFMFEELRECAIVLNEKIQYLASVFQNIYNIEEWSSVQSIAQDEVDVIGSICCDGEGKLNSSALLLEGSLETSLGMSVQLDVSCLSQYSFFPGQIIAAKAINSQGNKCILKRLYEESMLPFSSISPSISADEGFLQIVIAAGPFTTADALSYEPLSDILNYVREHKPHVCILIGPFVDSKHEIIEKENLSETFEEIFNQQIEIMLNSIKGITTKIILIPSLRDIHHYFVYPTPPFNLKTKHKSEQLICMPDPCIMTVDGVVIGVTSTDILFHIGKEEVTFPPTMSDRLGRLCRHILNQHSFYPLYPPNEVNISYEHLELYAKLPVTPHILILPSDLRSFIKDINGCCCINPERVTKGLVGGNFARIQVKSINKDEYNGSLISNITAEIVKI